MATEHVRPLGGGPFVFTTVSLGCNSAENPRVVRLTFRTLPTGVGWLRIHATLPEFSAP